MAVPIKMFCIMIAKVGSSRSIADTLDYNCNAEKDGRILLSSGIDPYLPPEILAHALEKIHNPNYRVKMHTIILSHSPEDSKKLTLDDEVKCAKAFLKELENEGVDLDSSPWVLFRHDNTNCTHYHIAIMNTCYDGSRFNDKFLGVKAGRAAARASMAIGLQAAPRAVEKAEKDKNKVKRVEPRTKKFFDRKAAIEEAKKRKQKEIELRDKNNEIIDKHLVAKEKEQGNNIWKTPIKVSNEIDVPESVDVGKGTNSELETVADKIVNEIIRIAPGGVGYGGGNNDDPVKRNRKKRKKKGGISL